MKNKTSIILIITIMLFGVFFSCRKDAIEIQSSTETEDPREIPGYDPEIKMITADLFGRIIDENNNSVEGALIKIEGITTTTNEFGAFAFADVQMNEFGTLVTASKEGFVLGSRLFFPQQGDEARVKIQLIPESGLRIIPSNQGGIVKIDGDVEIDFESNSFVKLDGTEFVGDVYVTAKYLDPTIPQTLDQMPGALVGIQPTENNREVSLLSFGIVTVNLETVDGQTLKLEPGAEAEIKLPIPEILSAIAPEEISMSFFNEDIGRWVEEEIAYLDGNHYVGKVEHFTFWTFNSHVDLVNLKLTVTTENGLPYANEQVVLKIDNRHSLSFGWTNADGIVIGKIPANIELRATITDNCDQSIYDETLGSFTSDAEIDIDIDANNNEEIRLSGTFICDGQALDNALLIVDIEDAQKFYFISSSFEQSIIICPELSGQVSATLLDLESGTASSSFTLEVDQENQLAVVDICEEDSEDPIVPNLDEYISINYKGANTVFAESTVQVVDFVSPGYSRIRGEFDDKVITVQFHGLVNGDYTGQNASNGLSFANNVVTMKGADGRDEAGALDNFEVTDFGMEGEYIVGSFSGELTQKDTDNRFEIKGLFRVKVPESDYNGTYFELIASGFRYVRPDMTGFVNTTTGNFQSRAVENAADLSTVNFVLRDYLNSNFSVVHLFVLPENMNVLIQNTGNVSDAEIINFGGVGELVSGFYTGTYDDILSASGEDSDYYLYYNIERLEDQ